MSSLLLAYPAPFYFSISYAIAAAAMQLGLASVPSDVALFVPVAISPTTAPFKLIATASVEDTIVRSDSGAASRNEMNSGMPALLMATFSRGLGCLQLRTRK